MNLFTAFFASRVISAFDGTIEKVVALAALMPIVAGIHRGIPARRAAGGGQGLPLDVAGHRAQLRVLYPGGAVGRHRSARGYL